MKHLKQGLLLATLLVAQNLLACSQDGKDGIVPENDLNIAVDAKRLGGITEETFNATIDKVEALYSPIVSSAGGKLEVVRNWTDGTVNAYAQQTGTNWKVSMFGGLARHDTITGDGFALVICHEIGHHIGGAPKKRSFMGNAWASNEGQADYFSTLKCLRKVWVNDNNESIVSRMKVDSHLVAACDKQWSSSEDRALCIRGGMAGDSVSRLFAALRNTTNWAKFETPDQKVVTTTDDNHPAYQCRLDTYFQGALCEVSMNEDVETASEVKGTCHGTLNHAVGVRPKCWHKPAVQ
ncbi:MAG TPA: hypothetical protein VNJ01_02590 [Bacteriovoracaceae bacterium]|nr:hypothetical protein [Bacteriovoracaceae bacterium]